MSQLPDKRFRIKPLALTAVIAVMLFVELFGFLLIAPTAHAQFGGPTHDPIAHAQRESILAREQTSDRIGQALLSSLLGSLVQGASFFMRRLAYDSARYLASSAAGQKPLVFQDGFGNYLGQTAGDALATTVEQLGQPFGLNLCQLPSIDFQIYLQISIRELYPDGSQGPQPTCTWSEFKDNWSLDSINERFDRFDENRPDNVEEFFSQAIRTESSDFDIALGAIGEVDRVRAEAREAGLLDRVEGQGFRSVTDIISGDIQTPAQIIREESEAVTAKHQGELSAGQIAGIYGAGALQVLPVAASVFVNTFVSELLSQLLTDGLVPPRSGGGSDGGAADFFSGAVADNRRAAERAFAFILTTVPVQLNTFDVVSTYAACPTNNPGLNNCVIDTGLEQAITRGTTGEPMTIREAMDTGLLHRDWLLIPPTRIADNGGPGGLQCHLSRYCYSNIAKLRRARILPLGFEIAALRSDPDQPWTLGQVVDNFENCGVRDSAGIAVADAEHPFCHLIDPNWIIKAPVARCEASVNGPQLASDVSSIRQNECVDISTCISHNADGSCQSYGFCTREKNVWNFPGELCEEHEATCQTYINDDTGAVASYLARTVDVGSCSEGSVGCRTYSTEQVDGEWVSSAEANDEAQLAAFKAVGRNQSVHFNQAIADSSCSEGAAGCSLFYEALEQNDGTFAVADDPIYLQKAPAHLGCYDIDRETPATDWPTTESELNLVSSDAACGDFASVCLPSEVGCDSYIPLDGGLTIPGLVGNSSCTAECVGYDAFTQLASEFEGEDGPLYFIPDNGLSCSSADVGCSEFTNLDTIAAGGEGLEYYTDIKYCERPADEERSNEKTFYSWEGTVEEGFTLQIHKLKWIEDSFRAAYIETVLTDGDMIKHYGDGSPAIDDNSVASLEENYTLCNAGNYAARVNNDDTLEHADADCREFFDDEGGIYYRLLANTVTVSDSCSPLRISQTSLAVADLDITQCEVVSGLWDEGSGTCQLCMGGGEYRDGSCIYNTISTESNSCAPAANGCREYAGNFANNIYPVATFEFEPFGDDEEALSNAKLGWNDSAAVVAESIQVGGHSLANDGDATLDLAPFTLRSGALVDVSYELAFWARGDSQSVRITFEQEGTTIADFTLDPIFETEAWISIGDTWRPYQLGPAVFTQDIDEAVTTTLRFSPISGSGTYFVDSFTLDRVQDNRYLVRDSWKTDAGFDVPVACDGLPNDGLPGAALGCRAYIAESTAETVYTAGFDQLCRPEAVGCTGFFDTYNTETYEATAYNVWCAQTDVGTCTVSFDGIDLGECQVVLGEKGCYVDSVTLPLNADLDAFVDPSLELVTESTIVIPQDTAEPIYLANRNEFQCVETELGCTAVGLETQVIPDDEDDAAYTHTQTYVLNNPANYDSTLCRDDQVGCQQYSTDNEIVYFKDPTVTGNTLCVYRDSTGSDDVVSSGWFMDGIGRCSNDGTQLCTTAEECPAGDDVTCNDIGNVACYEDYLLSGNSYGIRSNGTEEYEGFVGICDAGAHGCTEFVDRADTTQDADGTAYYVIDDGRLQDRVADCGGEVSLREGCVLFDQTDVPEKLYNASATYELSEGAAIASGGDSSASLVAPDTSDVRDSNIILRVARDRQCSEWLACKNEVTFFDDNGDPQRLCYQYAACDESNGETCTNFVDPIDNPDDAFLTQDNYVERDTTWYGHDYSGYSLFERYPVGEYTYISVDDSPTTYVAYKVDDAYFDAFPTDDCSPPEGEQRDDWESCGPGGGGRCWQGACVYPTAGTFPTTFDFASISTGAVIVEEEIGSILESGSCKAYPEQDSPFPNDTEGVLVSEGTKIVNGIYERTVFINKKPDFRGANVCQDGNCSCGYSRIQYQNGTVDFWESQQDIPDGICSAGENDDDEHPSIGLGESMIGAPCRFNSECGVDGTCSEQTSHQRTVGTLGYCLERDLSRTINGGTDFACLTWLPIEVSASQADVYNTDLEAGYYPEEDAGGGYGQVYCEAGTGIAQGLVDSLLFVPGDISSFPIDGQTAWAEDTYGALFYDSGAPRPGGVEGTIDRKECESGAGALSARSPWIQAQCDDHYFTRMELTYSHMQTWGWGVGGSDVVGNRALLRFDNYYPYNGQSTVDTDFQGILPQPSKSDPQELFPHSFIPDYNDFGVMMHGPRFGLDDEQENFAYRNPNGEKVNTKYFLPAPLFSDYDDVLYRSESETLLRETDLKRVFFVPMAFPDGSMGVNPGIGMDDLYIDFHSDGASRSVDQAGSDVYTFMTVHSDSGAGEAWSYILDSDDSSDDALFDFRNYYQDETSYTLEANGELPDFGGRNEIARRYLLVYHHATEDPPFTGTNPTQSPFAATCSGDSDPYQNWFAIGMDFNEDGEFLGYISRWCHGNGDSNGIKMAVVAEYVDHCTAFAQVYDDTADAITGTTNKAWTDRIWDLSSVTTHPTYSFLDRSVAREPFGSLPFTGRDVQSAFDDETNPLLVTNSEVIRFLRNAPFYSASSDGAPYSCDGVTLIGASSWLLDQGKCDALPHTFASSLEDKTTSTGQDAVDALFALVFHEVRFLGQVHEDSGEMIDAVTSRDSSGSTSDLLPPQIFSLNPATCNSSDPIVDCTAGDPHNFSINGINSSAREYGDDGVLYEDIDNDGNPDGIGLIQTGTFPVTAQFFAFADHERMPIRHVYMDWGDGTGFLPQTGLYANRKPYCGDSNAEGVHECTVASDFGPFSSQLTCAAESDNDCLAIDGATCEDQGQRFGNADRSCTEGYFEYTHDYSCDSQTTDYLRAVSEVANPEVVDRLLTIGLELTDQVCVFKPRVQVLDNWGWCNGSDFDVGEDRYVGRDSGFYGNDCNSFNNDSWTYYQGEIIVIPDDEE